MKIIFNKNELLKYIHKTENLGFVPTMGGIHMGHVSLIKKSLKECDKTIVSIFVNRPQFNKKSDYKRYPKTLRKDFKILKKLKVDYVYLPTNKQIYPSGPSKKIKICTFAKRLCGKNRPGHFRAVVDVIDRFIKIIKPKKIYLGEKDFQQLRVIEDFIRKNKIKTKTVGCKTVREKNGIPFSSRNFLLSNKEKQKASKVYKLIKREKNVIIRKKLTLKKLRDKIINIGINKIDYIQVLNINKIIKPYKKNNKYKIFLAYYLGQTRLIDNI